MKRLALIVALSGCAHHVAREKHVTMDPIEFHATKQGTVEIVDPAELFAEAGKRYAAKQYKEAVEIYDRVATQFAESRFVTPSLYNAGLCLESAGDLDGAADRYRKLIARGGAGSDVIDAQYRLGAVYERATNWAAAGQEWAEILERKDLTLSDRVEAMSRRGVAQFNLKDLVAAERTFRETQRFFQDHQDDERLDTSYFLAMSAYYIGQVAHEEYRLLPVRLPEKQMAQDLESKARMLMTAQTRYLDAMKVNNGEWATAAGFQIASLYREFYDDLVGAPIPTELSGEAREVYLEELKKQVRNLLSKAMRVHERNVLMAERIGVTNEWVKRSNEQMEQLRKLLVPGAAPTDPTPLPPAPEPPPMPKPREDARPHPIM